MTSLKKRPEGGNQQDELQELFSRFDITRTTANLLAEEGYTSIKLLENLARMPEQALNDIPGLRGAQKTAVKAMLMSLVPPEQPPPYSSLEEVVGNYQQVDPGNVVQQNPGNQLPPPDIGNEFTEEFPIYIQGAMMGGRTVTVNVMSNDSVTTVLEKTKDVLGLDIPLEDITLNFVNRRMEMGHTLNEYHVTRDSTLWVAVRAHGGSMCICRR